MPVQRISSILVASLVGSALVVAIPTSAVAETKKLSAAKYAEMVCGTLSAVKKADDSIASRAENPGLVNFAPSQQEAILLVAEYQAIWADAAATLETTSPKVRNGEKIGKLFVDYATRGVDELQKAIDTFTAVPPTDPKYLGALTSFAVAAIAAREKLGSPLKRVTDGSVRKAFDREKTCEGMFPNVGEAGVADPDVRITEFPIPTANASLFAIAAGRDGNVWFTELGANKIGKIDPSTGKVTEFPTAPIAAPRNITAGPDGNLWFLGDQVGKIDPETGVVTAVPTANAFPNAIVDGPDGNLWFTDQTANQIGKIDPDTGAVTLFPIPTPNFRPRSITTGPDGNLWFTGFIRDKIGKVDPKTGVVTELTVPAVQLGSSGIASGSDGNLWYTTVAGSKVKKLDPDTGAVTEFPTPTPAAAPYAITAGCDGNLWLTEETGNQIGRINPKSGVMTEFPVPQANAEPFGIAAGPDGNLWFTEQASQPGAIPKIGKVDPGISKKQKNAKIYKECLKATKA